MSSLTILTDMVGRHEAHDVYDLWCQRRGEAVLFGWQTAAGARLSWCRDTHGEVHPVAVPWTPAEAQETWAAAALGETRLFAEHGFGVGGDEANCGVRLWLGDQAIELAETGASLLFPTASFDDLGEPLVAMVRTVDVENADGVIDQHNTIVVARRAYEGWEVEEVADLAYGLLPRAGVWGYPGKRRRPFLVPDDRGGLWLLWERKEPHDGNTNNCHGVLLGRRLVDGAWAETVRIIEEPWLDFAPDPGGVVDGRLIVAAQRGVPIAQPGRGEVVLLSADLTDCPVQAEDGGAEGWTVVDLARRDYFTPRRRSAEIDGVEHYLLFGDPHTHTALSEDAEGDLTEMLAYARDKAQIDFVAITDNDYIYGGRLSDEGWRETMIAAEAWSEDGAFIVIPAYEWTQAKWGAVTPQHRSILFGSYDQPMLRWADAGLGWAHDPFEALLSWIESTDGIMNTQHARFALSRSPREANMEVVCGWGDYINRSGCFHEHLNAGFEAGFVGTSDGHRRTPGLGGGLTGLWVREFTLAGIIEAMSAHRCYATAGARIGLQFAVNEAFMGGRAAAAESYVARVRVEAPREIERLEVFGDGRVVATREGLPATCDFEIGDLPLCAWYYARVTLPGGFPEYPSNIAPAEGPWAWSSPVFVGR